MYKFCFTKILNQAFLELTLRFLYILGYSGPRCGSGSQKVLVITESIRRLVIEVHRIVPRYSGSI